MPSCGPVACFSDDYRWLRVDGSAPLRCRPEGPLWPARAGGRPHPVGPFKPRLVKNVRSGPLAGLCARSWHSFSVCILICSGVDVFSSLQRGVGLGWAGCHKLENGIQEGRNGPLGGSRFDRDSVTRGRRPDAASCWAHAWPADAAPARTRPKNVFDRHRPSS
jgi:hypothetical protein